MSFLTRWDDDHSRPKFTSALRDVLVRAVLPAVGIFVAIVGFGFLLKGPLESFSKWENGISTSFEDGRTETWNTITKFMSMIGNTEYVIAVGVIVCAIVWWRTKEWWFAVVPAHRHLAAGDRLRHRRRRRRPRAAARSSGSTRPRRPRATRAATSVPPPRSTSRSR